MNIFYLFSLLILLFVAELIYFRIAAYFNITDSPNNRSSHTEVTLRGGGIIFSLALLLSPVYTGGQYIYFLTGLALISFISFLDDLKPVSSKWRILAHLVGVTMMFIDLRLFDFELYWGLAALFFVIGSINAINFMDGINGITGSYSLVTLGSLYFINTYLSFTSPGLILTAILAVLVFNFFNFRTKAICFAGDVGSIGMAFILLFFILQLIIKTENLNYVLLILIYGLDTVTTIALRLIRKENIFEAHRSHFYQYLTNEKKMPHLVVASLYAIVQMGINAILFLYTPNNTWDLILWLFCTMLFFIFLRFLIEGREKLIGRC